MTLVAVVVQGDAAYLYSDTGHFDPKTGVLLGTADKIMQGHRFPWACGVTFSGPLQALRGFGALEARDADGLFDRLPRAITDFRKRSRKLAVRQPGHASGRDRMG